MTCHLMRILICQLLCTLLIAGFSLGNAAAFAADARVEPKTQFCWAIGEYDDTAYYAEAEDREDRSTSFQDFAEIMGIVHTGVHCRTRDAATHQSLRPKILGAWRAAGLSPVNTTFLSDMDY